MTDFLESVLSSMSSAFNSSPTPADGTSVIELNLNEDKTLKWRSLLNNSNALKSGKKSNLNEQQKQQNHQQQQQQQQQQLLLQQQQGTIINNNCNNNNNNNNNNDINTNTNNNRSRSSSSGCREAEGENKMSQLQGQDNINNNANEITNEKYDIDIDKEKKVNQNHINLNTNNKKQTHNSSETMKNKDHNKINTRRRKVLQNKKPLENSISASRRTRRSRLINISNDIVEVKEMTANTDAVVHPESSSSTTANTISLEKIPKRRGRSKKNVQTEIVDNSSNNSQSLNLNDVKILQNKGGNESQNCTLTTNHQSENNLISSNARQNSPSGRKLRRSERNSIPDEIKQEEIESALGATTSIKLSGENVVTEIEESKGKRTTRRSERLESRYETVEENGNKIQIPVTTPASQEIEEIKEEPKRSPENEMAINDDGSNEKKQNPPLIKMPTLTIENTPKRRGRRTKAATPDSAFSSDSNALTVITPPNKKSRNSKENGENSNIIMRKDKTNESSSSTSTLIPVTSSISQRPLRRIKPTVKILENEELRYEFETKNIARITACSDLVSTAMNSPAGSSGIQVIETSAGYSGNGSKMKKEQKDEIPIRDVLPKATLLLPSASEEVKRKLFPPIGSNLNVDNIYPAPMQRPCPDPQTFLSEIKAAKINLHKSPENKKLNRKQHRKLLKQKEKHFEKLGLIRNMKDNQTENDDSSTDNEEFLPPKKLNVGKPSVTLRLRNKENSPVSSSSKSQQKLAQRKRSNSHLSSSSGRLQQKIPDTSETNPITPINRDAKKEHSMICLCQKPSQYYTRNTPETAFCCAIDSIEDEKVGCCNQLDGELLNLLRPSHRVGYMILCDDHKKRLLAHNCCASCGIFCTQGKFILCKQEHFFHAECAQKYILNTPYDPTNTITTYPSPILVLKCPHCGCDTPEKTSLVTMKCNSLPVFLPSQRALIKPAKMTVPENDLGTKARRQFPSVIEMDKLIPESVISIALQRQAKNTNPPIESEFTSNDMFYAINHDDLERVAEIIASGYDITSEMSEFLNGTCLHLVAHFGTVQMAYLLLCRESSEHFLNMIDKELRTPSMCAVIGDKCDILKLFIQCGADLSLKGSDGMTCLHMAAKLGSIAATQLIVESYKNCTSIINFKKFLNAQDDGGWTAMVWAAENGFTDIVSYLISHGADTNVCDTENNTVLHWATLSNRIETIMILLQANTNCNQQNINGDTPLHIACRQSSTRICLMLIANEADLMVKNKASELPYDCIPNEESQCARAVGFNMQMRSFGPTGLKNKVVCSDISNGREVHPVQAVRSDRFIKSKNEQDDEIMLPDFKYIVKSILLQNSIQIDSRVSQMRICSCNDGCNSDQCQCSTISVQNWYTLEGRLNNEFSFDDPPMIFECNDVCGCNKLICKNRVVQNGIKVPLQVFECDQRLKGWGVRSLIQIPRGTFISEYTGEILTDLEADRRTDDSYFFDLGASDHCIDANYYGNVSRFFNHSCSPNIVPVRVYYDHQDFRFPKIAFFACKDIVAGEELSFDYGDKFWTVKQKYFSCQCKSSNCRYSNNINTDNTNSNSIDPNLQITNNINSITIPVTVIN